MLRRSVRHLSGERTMSVISSAIAPNGDLYVGNLVNLPEIPSGSLEELFLFSETRPFNELRLSCLLALPWPEGATADGVFWTDEKPDICFRLRISNGSAAFRPFGRWLASGGQSKKLNDDSAEALSGRAWDDQYGDRVQRIGFQGLGEHRSYIQEMLSRCLITSATTTKPNYRQ